MIYTTQQFRVNSETKTIELYKDLEFAVLYKKLVYLWSEYTEFSKVIFPNKIIETLSITKNIKIRKTYLW